MSRARSSKKRNRPSGARPAARRSSPQQQQQQQPPPLGAQILPGAEAQRPRTPRPPGAVTSRRRREVSRAEQVETEEKNFYGETAIQMLRRVRRELLNIVMLAAISFAVGLLVVQLTKV